MWRKNEFYKEIILAVRYLVIVKLHLAKGHPIAAIFYLYLILVIFSCLNKKSFHTCSTCVTYQAHCIYFKVFSMKLISFVCFHSLFLLCFAVEWLPISLEFYLIKIFILKIKFFHSSVRPIFLSKKTSSKDVTFI